MAALDPGCTDQGNELGSEKAFPHVTFNGGEHEWYTPVEFIEAARATMGRIDLDPASCAAANRIVMADRFYTKAQNGLKHAWLGNVWLNPPYARPLIGRFAEKLVAEVGSGNVKQAIVLVNNATDTIWFQRMLDHAAAICFVAGRVKFIDVQGDPSGEPLQGQVLLYFGRRVKAFKTSFGRFGACAGWNVG